MWNLDNASPTLLIIDFRSQTQLHCVRFPLPMYFTEDITILNTVVLTNCMIQGLTWNGDKSYSPVHYLSVFYRT